MREMGRGMVVNRWVGVMRGWRINRRVNSRIGIRYVYVVGSFFFRGDYRIGIGEYGF